MIQEIHSGGSLDLPSSEGQRIVLQVPLNWELGTLKLPVQIFNGRQDGKWCSGNIIIFDVDGCWGTSEVTSRRYIDMSTFVYFMYTHTYICIYTYIFICFYIYLLPYKQKINDHCVLIANESEPSIGE